MIVFYLPGEIAISAYSLLLAVGAVVGLAWVVVQSPAKARLARLDAGLSALFGGLLGGRLVYVLVNWAYFSGQPWQILQVHLGGLSWPGALAGGLLFLWLFARWVRRRPAAMADALLPLLLILATGVWLGCWLDGSVYGWPLSAWWALPARDEWGLLAPRWPLQLFGAAASLALLWLLGRPAARLGLRPGVRAGLGLLGLSATLFGLSFLRADVALTWQGLRLDAWAALIFAAASLAAILFFQFKKNLSDN